MSVAETDRPEPAADVASPPAPAQRRRHLARAALLVSLGLLVEVVSLLWSHPTAFLLFLAPGALLVAAGVVVFLWEVVQNPVQVG